MLQARAEEGGCAPNTSKIVKLKKQEVLSVFRKLQLLDDPIGHPLSKAGICRQAGVSKIILMN